MRQSFEMFLFEVILLDGRDRPVGGWMVMAEDPDEPLPDWMRPRFYSDAEGRVQLLDVPAGKSTTLVVYAPDDRGGFHRLPVALRPGVVLGAEPTQIRLSSEEARPGRVGGRWLGEGGRPVAGAELVLGLEGRERTTGLRTGPGGEFELGAMPAGRYRMTLGEGVEPVLEFELAAGEELDFDADWGAN